MLSSIAFSVQIHTARRKLASISCSLVLKERRLYLATWLSTCGLDYQDYDYQDDLSSFFRLIYFFLGTRRTTLSQHGSMTLRLIWRSECFFPNRASKGEEKRFRSCQGSERQVMKCQCRATGLKASFAYPLGSLRTLL